MGEKYYFCLNQTVWLMFSLINTEEMKPVFLTGYMCSGKTTLGRELAAQMGLRFLDLDEYIESETGHTINELFARVGEARFRQMETEALRRVAGMTDVVISCGGGTPCHSGNMELMNQLGTTVWLWTSPERIIARLQMPEHRVKRPATAGLSDEEIAGMVHRSLEQRTAHYAKAKLKFDSTRIETAEETVATAAELAEILRSESDGRQACDILQDG